MKATTLGRLARLDALAENREATQFQPLDPSSPTILLQVRVPQSLLDRIDGARGSQTRSQFVRNALERSLTE